MTSNSSGAADSVPQFKKFVSETELEEKKRKRQEEWERVRQPDQPLEAPSDDPEDPRSLYERLKEQKDLKQAEHEDKFKLKNQVHGLEEDEASFLDMVSRRQEELLEEREQEENEILEEYRMIRSNEVVVSADAKPAASSGVVHRSFPVDHKQKPKQSELLAGAVKRKRSSNEPSSDQNGNRPHGNDELARGDAARGTTGDVPKSLHESSDVPSSTAAATVVGILPGICSYTTASSESDSSSDSDIDTDMFKRAKLVQAVQQQQNQQH